MPQPPGVHGFVELRSVDGDELLAELRQLAASRLGAPSGATVTTADGARHWSRISPELARDLLDRIDGGATSDEVVTRLYAELNRKHG